MNRRRVVVTGGGGFIGRAVHAELTNRDCQTIPADLPDYDVRTLQQLPAADAVIHLAGVLGTDELFDIIDTAIDTNVKGTARVLEAARQQRLAYVGITMPPVFPSIYTATKIAATGLEKAYHHTYALPVSRVCAFNAYGMGQKHGPGHPQKLIPTFAVEAWANRPIPIWGDGQQTVDLIHVNDLARLLVDALDHGDDVTFDGGCGTPITVNEVARIVLDVTGSHAGVRHLPMRRGEAPTRIVATGEGWDRLDWKPTLSMEALVDVVQWYRNHSCG